MIAETTPETLTQLANRVKRCRLTVWRWVNVGVVVNGNRVKLAARKLGGVWTVSAEAWQQWEADTNPQAPKLPESPAAEQRRAERERDELLRRLGRL
jgi:hypothetical protein